ncbi:ABC transporter permease [Virgibacillus sp. M23]|uniref:ABC transporter permease n=1 Tax=Virgibacillus sp. M23 TaxID=3079030 RepID=UPI002A90D1BB|nr:ABC transporter permease [Virgibacillus sp. M23]MDY7044910.1 ABC transporter permease [Virgibacillus sp. M23]
MFDSHAFFKNRFAAHVKETSRYLRYIFNGHIAVALLFFISALAFYYQKWLLEIPENFPAAIIIGTVFGMIASYSPVRTLLKEPDLVFLIAAEHKMGPYFRNTLLYSFIIQLYLVLLAAAALGPLYSTIYDRRSGQVYMVTIAVLLLFKAGNLIANWWMLKVREPGVRRTDITVRTVLNVAVFYFLIDGNMLLAGISTVLFTALFLYIYQTCRKQPGIVWDLLVEKDQNRMQAFYRLANMFADVPHLKSRVRKRQWLVKLVSSLPFMQKYTYDYLYRVTFIRSGDYLGMFVRLIVIGGLFIYFIPSFWLKVVFAILFLYLSSFQMMALYQHHRTVMWIDLYPVSKAVRQASLMKLLFQLTGIQTVIFSIVFIALGQYLGMVIVLISGSLFNFLFILGYVKKKLI